MRTVFTLLMLTVCSLFISAQAPTVPSSDLSFNQITGQSLRIGYTRGDGERRIIVFSENPVMGIPEDGIDYNPDLTFTDGDLLLADEFVMFDGVSPGTSLFTGLVPATTYYVSIFEYNGEDQQTEYLTTPATGTFTTLGQPSQQVSAVTARNQTGHSATVAWTNGNGDGRIAVMREGGPVTANPIDLESYSNLGQDWRSNSSDITPGNRVMFNTNSARDTFQARYLEPDKTYFVDLFEYAGNGNGKVYAVPGSGTSFTTAERPTEVGTITDFGSTSEGDRFQTRYTQGNGQGRIFVVKEGTDLGAVLPQDGIAYNADTDFGDGDELAPGVFVVRRINNRSYGNPVNANFTVRNLEPGTTYTIGMFDFDYEAGFTGLINYQTVAPATYTFTTAAAPTLQASDGSVLNNVGNAADLTYARGNGDGAFVVMKAGAPVDFVPEDTRSYGSSSFFGSSQGDRGNGNYSVYRGGNQPPTTRSLTPGTTYHVAVWEYNGNSGPVYTQPPLRFSFQASLTPTESATDMVFSSIEGDRIDVGWDTGNGQRRVLIARQGQPVTAEPANGTTRYNDGNGVFGSGTELLPGQFVVSDNNLNGGNQRPTITNLAIATEYHFALFEYNEDAQGETYYRRTLPATGAQSTAAAPTMSATDIGVEEINAVSARFFPNDGNGERRFLVMKEGSAVDFIPQNLTRYGSNMIFGQEDLGGGNSSIGYKVFPSTRIPAQNLLANTTYHVALFELNGRDYPVYNTDPLRYDFTTPIYATAEATSPSLRNLGAEKLQWQFFRGNGSSRIVVARLADSLEVLPQDGMEYLADEAFGAGSDLGGGNFVVHDETRYLPNNRLILEVNGLEKATEYVLTTYEVTSDGTDLYYRLPGVSQTVMTVDEPSVAPVNLQIIDTLITSATIAWTTGNGDGEVILVSEGSPVSELVQTGTMVSVGGNFNPNQANFIGNAQPVYFGAQTTRNLTGLKSGTEYFVSVQAYNGWRNSPAYQQTGVTTSFRTLGPPAIQAADLTVVTQTESRITLRWTKGGGTDRLLVAKQGSPVDALPVDDVEYTPNTFFGSGDDLGNGNFAIAAGDFDTISVTDLIAGEVYHFAVFEYNIQGQVLYNRNMPPTAIAVAESTLPVTWSYFQVEAVKSDAFLTWATSTEINARRYVVERASNGTFEPVGTVTATGPGVYSFTDRELPAGTHTFRLRQEDYDGAFAYSPVRNVTIAASTGLIAYPNPTTGVVNILGADAGAEYLLKSGVGKTLLRGTITSRGIDTGHLAPGIYLLQIGNEMLKIIRR